MIPTVRRAGPGDEEAARRILDEYDEAIGVVIRDDPATRRDYLDGSGALWFAEAGGALVGCVALKAMTHATERAAEVKRLYVRPASRIAGCAGALMDALETHARDAGFEALYLDTFEGLAAAVRLYDRRGYARIARYNDNPQADVFMRLALR